MTQDYVRVKPRFYHRQTPFREIYIALYCLSTALLIPVWFLQVILLKDRPRKNWSIIQCVAVKLIRNGTPVLTRARIRLSRDKQIEPRPGSLKHTRFFWAPPIDVRRIPGIVTEMAEINNVVAVRTGCFVFSKNREADGQAKTGEVLVIYFHGGGYSLGTAHEMDLTNRVIPKALLRNPAVEKVLSVDYRLVSDAPFPGALLDGLSAYAYAREVLGYDHIFLCGDSAGGNLAFGVERLIRDTQAMALPTGVILISPWCDMTLPKGGSIERNRSTDVLDKELGPYSTSLFFANLPPRLKLNAYCSPGAPNVQGDLQKLFLNMPPTLFIGGDAEILVDEITFTHQRLKEAGCDTTMHWEIDACHDFVIFPFMEPMATRAMAAVGKWIEQQMGRV